MHVLFVHKNYPAQFGHIAGHLVAEKGWQCTYVSELPDATLGGVRRIQYKLKGGANKNTHYCSRTFENYTWHSHAVFETLRAHPEVQPDLIVGHSGFGSTALLADLFDCPIVNFFEWYYQPHGPDVMFRPEYPPEPMALQRSRMRNGGLLIDLQASTLGYSPTEWQRSQFPAEYQTKIETIFDGIDTDFWYRMPPPDGKPRWAGGRKISPETKIVTYVSRGFESARGFDVFMKVAKRICEARSDVVFVCVGSDRCCYGSDDRFTAGKSFREHVLAQDEYDLDRFIFTGRVSRMELMRLFGISDLHMYLTIPFVLSWSCLNALACGCTLVSSATPPVEEIVVHEQTGLLASFHDVDGLTDLALAVLNDPNEYRPLGQAGARLIEDKYSLSVCMPKMLRLYERAIGLKTVTKSTAGDATAPIQTSTVTTTIAPDHNGDSVTSDIVTEQKMTPSDDDQAISATPRHPLRVLVTIPHCYKPNDRREFGSMRQSRKRRVKAIARCICALHSLYCRNQYVATLARPEHVPANLERGVQLNVVVCTTRTDHLIPHLRIPTSLFEHATVNVDPMMLGFECHALLRDRLDDFDYFCYMEDDLVLHDPATFDKLRWFTESQGSDAVLQPNRYEISLGDAPRKVYIDGDLQLRMTSSYQDIGDRHRTIAEVFGNPIAFSRPLNPHSGCFFLNAEQMKYWSSQSSFLDRNTSFYSPLESAATLGIMQTFRVYKPVPANARFFEIEHFGNAWTKRISRRDSSILRDAELAHVNFEKH